MQGEQKLKTYQKKGVVMGIKKENGKFAKSIKERIPRKIKKALKKTNQTKTI